MFLYSSLNSGCVSCSEYSLFKEQQGPLRMWLQGVRKLSSLQPGSFPHSSGEDQLSGLEEEAHCGLSGACKWPTWKEGQPTRKHRYISPCPHGPRRGCVQGDELLVPREIPSTDEGISLVKWQDRGTSRQWAGDHSCPLRKKVKKRPEQVLERKTSLQRERNRGRKNSSSKYSAEVQDATQRTSHLPRIMHPYTPAVNKCGQVDVKLYHPARVLGKEELRTCPYTGIKGRQLGGPVCCWAWKKLRQQGPLNSQPVTFDQHQRVLLGGIWK